MAIALLVAATWVVREESRSPALPEISTARLDSASAELIEQQLEAVRNAPRSGEAWGKLGAILMSFEFRAEAESCFETADRLQPKSARWAYLHARLLASRAPDEAIAKFRRAVDLCGNNPPTPRLRLASALTENGQWREAARQLEDLLRTMPDYAPAQLALARIHQAHGNLTEAVAIARQCTNDNRTARSAWTLLSNLHLRLGAPEAARQAAALAESAPPDAPTSDPFEPETLVDRNDPRHLSDQAQALLMAGRVSEAAPLVEQLARQHPDFSETWLLRGRKEILERDYDAAEQSLRRHLAMDPQSINGIFQLGMVYLSQERFPEAAAQFERATELKSDFGPAYFNLGVALARSGRKKEAIAPFREAIRHNPERVDSYILLADLYLQLGRRAEAIELADQAATVNPKDARLPALRAKISQAPTN